MIGVDSGSQSLPASGPATPPGPRLRDAPWWVWKSLRRRDFAVAELFDRYGDVVLLTMPRLVEVLPGVTRVALVRDPALIRPLFTASDEVVDSTSANRVIEMLYGPKSLLLMDGSEHRRLRKLLLPRLRGEALQQWSEFIVASTAKETATWVAMDSVRMHPRMLDVSLELILKIALSVSDADMPRWAPPMRELLETAASEEMTLRYMLRRLGALRTWKRFHRVLSHCNGLVFDEIARRRGQVGRYHSDLLDLLMHAEGEPLTDNELRDQIFTILIAGHETSATTASWAIERLMRNPQAMAAAVDEARGGDEQTYLEAVVHETLRLRPPVAVVGRVTRAPLTLGQYRFPPNVLIAPIIRAIHRAPQVHDDPDHFNPDRFLHTPPDTYTVIPFGGGPHRCLGDRLAIFQTKLVLQTILRTVDLAAVDLGDEKVKRKAIAYVPGNGALVRATPCGGRVHHREGG